MELSKEQKTALQLMQSGRNVFLTGSAGTGKSTVINEFKRSTTKKLVIVAPTGVAALNIGGQTIHSFFMLAPGLITEPEPLKFKAKKEIIRMVDTIIIDEISMVRSDVFAAIDKRCKEVALPKDRFKPFAGKQVICCGDFFQLSPIVGCNIEADWLNENLNGEFAFQTDLWKAAAFNNIVLKESFRQKDDIRFLSILNHVRHGTLNQKAIDVDTDKLSSIDALNKLCTVRKQFSHTPTRLCTTNREVQSINNEARAKINNPVVRFQAIVSGKFDEDNYPTEAELQLKIGCRVMILCNKRSPDGDFVYVNGDCGEIMDIKNHQFESKVKIRLDTGEDVWVGTCEWQNKKYVLDRDHFSGKTIIRQEVIGTFVQLPLKLAYAITIHKAQCMTLDCVDLRLGSGCFAHGQLYTALSRARSINGLQLERNILSNDLVLDDRVIDFYNDLEGSVQYKTSMEIPIEYEDQVKAFLESLRTNVA